MITIIKSLFMTDPLINKIFLRYMIPSMIGLFFSRVVLLIDSVVMGDSIGPSGLAAIGLIIPLTYIFNALCSAVGVGCGVIMARCGSHGHRDDAAAVFSIGVAMLVLASFVLTTVLLIFTHEIAIILGGSDDTLQHVITYLHIFGAGSISYVITFAFYYIMIQDNAQKLAMYGMMAGTIVHVVSDIILVYYAHMGVAGVALGTVIGQMASVTVYMLHFLKKDRLMHCRFSGMTLKPIRKIIHVGIPEGARYVTAFLQIWAINWMLLKFGGTIAVANGAIITNLMNIMSILITGISQPVIPLISAFWAANNTAAVRDTQKIALRYILILLLPVTLLLFFKPGLYSAIFSVPDYLLPITLPNIRVIVFHFIASCMVRISLNTCTTSGKPDIAFKAALVRMVTVLIFAFILGNLWGQAGVWASHLTTELLLLFWLIKYHGQMRGVLNTNQPSSNIWSGSGQLTATNLDLWRQSLASICGIHAPILDNAIFTPLANLFPVLQDKTPLLRVDLLKTGEGHTITTYIDKLHLPDVETDDYRVLTDINLGLCRRVLWLP